MTRGRALLAAGVALVAAIAVVLVAAGLGGDGDGDARPVTAAAPASRPDRFDAAAAWALLRRQVALGPRPAGSARSRRLARELRAQLPNGRFQAVPGGLRNVIGVVPGRDPSKRVLLGAHYDTVDLPQFVGANDGASGVAIVTQIARTLKPRTIRPTVVFALFDGEEAPTGVQGSFLRLGVRGSKVAAASIPNLDAMVLLDMVGDRSLSVPREVFSDRRLWTRLRAAARRAGASAAFPGGTAAGVYDDHTPFLHAGVPSIDLIDFDFPCWHQACDDLSAVSETSLDAVGETVTELLRRY